MVRCKCNGEMKIERQRCGQLKSEWVTLELDVPRTKYTSTAVVDDHAIDLTDDECAQLERVNAEESKERPV